MRWKQGEIFSGKKGEESMKRRVNTILVSVVLIGFVVLSSSVSNGEEVKTFEVKADKYKFIPGTITVNQGDKVIIKTIAIDKKHGIGIKAFGIKKLLAKGERVTVEFTADKKGEFTIRCTKFCGWKHFWMKGKLIVK
jgi:cytochrome c oxidase subunit 2